MTTYRCEALVTIRGERCALTRYLSAAPYTHAALSPHITALHDMRIVQFTPGAIARQRTIRDWAKPEHRQEFVTLTAKR